MRVALLTNTEAGSGQTTARRVEALLREAGAEVELHDVREAAPLGAPAAAGHGADVADDPPDRVVVAGGDGSIGPVAQVAQRAGVPLAVVATGTANDFARALGLPRDLEAACALAADPQAATREVEVGSAGGRPFVNTASAGLSVVAAAEAHDLKGRLGAAAYGVGALLAGVRGEPLHVRIAVDGEEAYAGDAWQVVVAATGHFGGGSSIGGTDVDDGHLDVAVVPAGSRLALPWRAIGMLRGALTDQDPVRARRGHVIEVEGVPEFNIDGERCDVEPARFTTAGRVTLVVPG